MKIPQGILTIWAVAILMISTVSLYYIDQYSIDVVSEAIEQDINATRTGEYIDINSYIPAIEVLHLRESFNPFSFGQIVPYNTMILRSWSPSTKDNNYTTTINNTYRSVCNSC